MTKKEIKIQMALGTIEPQNLTDEEFNYFVNIVANRCVRRLKQDDVESELRRQKTVNK